jgi:hypothetical protein
MSLSPETRERLQRQIDALRKRMQLDSNDLEYETHLHTLRMLQHLLDQK